MIKSWLTRFADPVSRWKSYQFPRYRADGFSVSNKNIGFLNDHAFNAAWRTTEAGNREAWKGVVPDVRWRAHIACWAATNARHLRGDFVECGVFTGLLSMTVMNYLAATAGAEFWKDRKFYLFDTFEGIGSVGSEQTASLALNATLYFDCFELAKRNFESFPSARLVRGLLPQSLDQVWGELNAIAYLSIDLNHAGAELATIERMWPRLVPGATVVIDDYAFEGHDAQYATWNEFAARHGLVVASLPTGQGLLLKL